LNTLRKKRAYFDGNMRHLDLFSGIGGFALAASWVWKKEHEIVGFCEIDKYCQKVLKKHWSNVPIYEDIRKLDEKKIKNIDLITGGFPCQDISIAGKGAGITGERSGFWTEMCRIIGGVRPRYALIENVPMLIHRGLGRVLSDLAKIGYDAEWQIISAKQVGARHLRKRIWIVVYPDSSGHLYREFKEQSAEKRIKAQCKLESCRENAGIVSDANRKRLEGRKKTGDVESSGQKPRKQSTRHNKGEATWATEPNVGRVANGIPSRVDRLKGLGNAIVPQVAEIIMRRIKRQCFDYSANKRIL